MSDKVDKNNEYNADSIQVLSDVNHVRLRFGMYIGSNDDAHQLFSEALDNAIDEIQSGYSEKAVVNVDTKNNIYRIRDYGRGIPHGMKDVDDLGNKKETIEVLVTKSFSGGKFDKENYSYSSGLNGVGLVCINALSSYLHMESYRDSKVVKLIAHSGDVDTVDYASTDEHNGTLIEFTPDDKIFNDNTVPLNFIINRCKVSSAFGINIELYIDNELINTESTIYDLIQEDSNDISVYDKFTDKVVDINTGEFVSFAISYTNDTGCKYKGYTNLLYNSQGGTHLKMIDSAITDAWNKFNISDVLTKDYYLGIRVVVAVFISETSFSSQTKERLTVDKSELKRFIPMISDKIYDWLNDNEDFRKAFIKRMQEYRASQNKMLSKKEIRSLLYINNDTNGSVRRKNVDPKLIECTSKDRSNTELLVVEGDSAAGSMVSARDIKIQAVLPIRGKILNVSKLNDISKCMNNKEIRSIVNSAGCGLFDDMDLTRSRYERYIAANDGDSDGLQIASLLCAIFINVLPDIVKAGMFYLSQPPLYGWKDKKLGYIFTNDRSEIPEGIEFSRYKGLGEMDPDELKYSILNVEGRELIKVQYPDDINRFNEIMTSSSAKFDMLMNEGVVKYKPWKSYKGSDSLVEES